MLLQVHQVVYLPHLNLVEYLNTVLLSSMMTISICFMIFPLQLEAFFPSRITEVKIYVLLLKEYGFHVLVMGILVIRHY